MPRCFGAEVDTGTFFEYVKEMMDGEDSIKVAHGQPPKNMKQEHIEQGEGRDYEEASVQFFSVNEVINLEARRTRQ
eukprot:1253970-Prymnesium_polylepis.1